MAKTVQELLDDIATESLSTNSDSCLIYHKETCLLEKSSGKSRAFPHIMSISKLIVTLGTLHAVDKKFLSLDSSLSKVLPEWQHSTKEAMTLRHILNHTSGLQNNPETTEEIYHADDWVAQALNAELSSLPGTVWSYNNKAMNLIPEIMRRATGMPLNEYINKNILSLLGIDNYEWYSDKARNMQGMAGICMRPEDLLKVARLLTQLGIWQDRAILSKETMLNILMAAPIFPEKGMSFWPILSQGVIVGWEANGSLGQYLAVFPHSGLHAIRIIEPERYRNKHDVYDHFLGQLIMMDKKLCNSL